ncbi:MAG: hypothetical protein HYX49_09165 [Chloroflexi bacterium]|nr:hypothetical protein [Chloroflexota bacterium]
MNQEQYERALLEIKAGKEDIRPSDVIVFSEPLRSTLTRAVRIGRISLTDLARELELERERAREIVELLINRNLLRVSSFSNDKETFYETRLSAMTRPLGRPPSDIFKKLDD